MVDIDICLFLFQQVHVNIYVDQITRNDNKILTDMSKYFCPYDIFNFINGNTCLGVLSAYLMLNSK